MALKRIVVGDGIYLNLIECDKFKTNCISVDFLSPLSPETAAHNALLPFVLTKGTKELPNMALLTKELDMLYGSRINPSVSKSGDVQRFGFLSYPLRKEYAEGCDITLEVFKLIGKMLNSPYLEDGYLSKEYTEREKEIMIDRINAQINDKAHYSLLRCREIMAEGEAYAIPETGRIGDLENVTEKSLTKALKTAMNTLRIEIYCIGVFDTEALISLTREIFSSPERKTPSPLTTERNGIPKEIKRITETQEIKQGKLCMGYKTYAATEKERLPAYTVFTEILSGSPTAKLFMNVREKKSLCYYCTAVSDTNKGIMIIASGINVSDKEEAEEAINEQIEAIRNGNITDSELEAARKSITNSIKSLYDDSGALRGWYLNRGIFKEATEPSEFLEKALSVTKEDIVEIAKQVVPDTVYFLEGSICDEEGENDYE